MNDNNQNPDLPPEFVKECLMAKNDVFKHYVKITNIDNEISDLEKMLEQHIKEKVNEEVKKIENKDKSLLTNTRLYNKK